VGLRQLSAETTGSWPGEWVSPVYGVFCQVEVSVKDRSLVQRGSLTECVYVHVLVCVSLGVTTRNNKNNNLLRLQWVSTEVIIRNQAKKVIKQQMIKITNSHEFWFVKAFVKQEMEQVHFNSLIW